MFVARRVEAFGTMGAMGQAGEPTPWPLRLYAAGARIALATAPLWLRLRARRGKEDLARSPERYGRTTLPRPDGPLVWFHAASVGETLAILPLIERIAPNGDGGINVLLTTGTLTSAKLAAERLPDGAVHQFKPLDATPVMRRFLDHWRPDVAVFAESEVWPVTVRELALRTVPQVLVNARMSDRSYRRWAKRPRVAGALFGRFAHVAAQSATDAERFRNLGAAPVTMTGNLKVDNAAPAHDAEELATLRETIGGRPIWLAASLHPDEDAEVIAAATRLRSSRPEALSILVPRHPERGNAIRTACEAAGLSVAQRSRGEKPRDADVYLGDTIGEMGLFFRLSPVAFMGKSLGTGSAKGGQNPLEAVACGAAVLTGREVSAFRDIYRTLVERGGAKLVQDAVTLATLVEHLWDHDEHRAAMERGAATAVAEMSGGLERTFGVLSRHLMPLRLNLSLARSRAEMGERERKLANLRADAPDLFATETMLFEPGE